VHIDPSRVQVAVGVLIRPDGYFLLTTRPAGKDYAGYWEFPGGKLEQGETVAQALTRELREELGIEVTQCLAWQSECIDYPHALVQLHFYKVLAWQVNCKCVKAKRLLGSVYLLRCLPCCRVLCRY